MHPRHLVVLAARARVPDRAALQDAMRALGFKNLVVDAEYQPFTHGGYLPCTLDGEDAGFDLRFGHVDVLPGDDRDTQITLRWGGDPRECAAALVFAATVAQGFGAIAHTPGDLKVIPGEELAAMARKALADC